MPAWRASAPGYQVAAVRSQAAVMRRDLVVPARPGEFPGPVRAALADHRGAVWVKVRLGRGVPGAGRPLAPRELGLHLLQMPLSTSVDLLLILTVFVRFITTCFGLNLPKTP